MPKIARRPQIIFVLHAVTAVCVYHRPEHDSDSTAVAVKVTTAYRVSGGIFLLFLTTALHGVTGQPYTTCEQHCR
jgi:hypothetical protein